MKNYVTMLLTLFVFSQTQALIVKDDKVQLEKLSDYNECQSKSYQGNICDSALRDWVEKTPGDLFQAGKLTRKKMNSWGAIYFFAKAFAAKSGDCKDKDVWLAIESAAALPGSYKEPIAGMKTIAFKHCFADLKDALVKAAESDKSTRRNICKNLIEKQSAPAKCKEVEE